MCVCVCVIRRCACGCQIRATKQTMLPGVRAIGQPACNLPASTPRTALACQQPRRPPSPRCSGSAPITAPQQRMHPSTCAATRAPIVPHLPAAGGNVYGQAALRGRGSAGEASELQHALVELCWVRRAVRAVRAARAEEVRHESERGG
jgi:hypothetical protein